MVCLRNISVDTLHKGDTEDDDDDDDDDDGDDDDNNNNNNNQKRTFGSVVNVSYVCVKILSSCRLRW